MTHLKKAAVWVLWAADEVLDFVSTNRHWGCRLGLATRSARLDERWGTNVWRKIWQEEVDDGVRGG